MQERELKKVIEPVRGAREDRLAPRDKATRVLVELKEDTKARAGSDLF